MGKVVFSHHVLVCVFLGRELKQPAPGSYDSKHYTPPTREVFKVSMQNDGPWWIELNGAKVADGFEWRRPSRQLAKQLLENNCARLLREPDFEKA